MNFLRVLLASLLLFTQTASALTPAQQAMLAANSGPLANIEAARAYIIAQKPTLFLDPDYVQSVTQDSIGRVSAISTLYGSVNNFTQGTDANKPVLSRPDRVENISTYSEQQDNAAWTKTRSSISANATTNPVDGATTADKLIEDSSTNTHITYNATNIVNGVVYRYQVYLKANERTYASIRIQDSGTLDKTAFANLTTCALGTVQSPLTATIESVSNGWCRMAVTFTSTATNPLYAAIEINSALNTNSYTGNGTSSIYVFGAQLQRSSMQPSYIATTTGPIYGSLTGRRMLTLDGSNDGMSSTSKSSDIFGTQAKEAFAVMHTNAINVNQYYFTGFDNYWAMRVPSSGSTIGMLNYDGTTDQANTSASANTTYVANFYHDTTNIAHRLNNGTFTVTASGASSSLNNVLWIGQSGASTAYLNGQLGPIITFNRVLPQPVRDTIRAALQKFWRVG